MPTVLLTRPLADSRRMADLLEADEIDSLVWPLTMIRPVVPENPIPPGIRGLLVTSSHGIRGFAAEDRRRDIPVLCVGDRTADVARSIGFAVVLSAAGDAAALARLAAGTGIHHFLYPRGRDVSHDLAAALAPGGQQVTDRVVYSAERGDPPSAPVRTAIRTGSLDAITLWSMRNAQVFVDWAQEQKITAINAIPILALSERTAAPLANLQHHHIRVVEHPDARSMMSAIREICAH